MTSRIALTYEGVPTNERRILLVGKTGVGKSSTGNALLGKYTFPAKTSLCGTTKMPQHGDADRFGRYLIVVDTPGMIDTDMGNDNVKEDIKKCHGLAAPGPHVVILVVKVGRITDEDMAVLRVFRVCFGEEVGKHTMIVFTGKGDLDDTIKEYVDEIENEEFKTLIKQIKNRYVTIGKSKEVTTEREQEVQEILGMIDSIIEENDGNFYSNKLLNNEGVADWFLNGVKNAVSFVADKLINVATYIVSIIW